MLRDLRGTCLKNLRRSNLEKRNVDRLLHVGKRCEDICAHQKMTSSQVHRVIYLVDSSQHLSLATPSLSMGLMNKVAIVAEMEVTQEHSNMDFLKQKMTWL